MSENSERPSYEELCSTLVYLEGPEDDGRIISTEELKLLLQANLLHWRAKDHVDVTDLGEQVARRLRDGGDAPEIRQVLSNAT